jgi:chemotaxis protein CheD
VTTTGARGDGPAQGVFLHAGHLAVSADPCTITTIVGSCVTVCLFDPVRRAGGANHYVLPLASASSLSSLRFGDVAVAELVRRMMALGCRQGDLQAKVFGGAGVFLASDRLGGESLGAKNVRMARQILGERRIPVVAEDLGGDRGRKVVFQTDAGDVWVRRL